jgi:tripartite-type tricarboxylate transporter receptor subunit TctC
VFNSSLYKTAPYDGLAELVPVALVYQFSYMLMASKSMPYASAKELIEAAKGKPDSLSVANAGVGTGQHLAAVAFQKFTGTKFVEVPYRGSALVYPDLLSGRVDLFFDSTAAALPYIKTGQVRGIATLTSKRDKQAPDMPTMTEAGVPGLEIESWIGLFAPAKTPPAAIERLQKEIAAIIPDMKERFETIGGDVMVMPPEKLKEFVRSEHDKWTRIIKDAGIVLD